MYLAVVKIPPSSRELTPDSPPVPLLQLLPGEGSRSVPQTVASEETFSAPCSRDPLAARGDESLTFQTPSGAGVRQKSCSSGSRQTVVSPSSEQVQMTVVSSEGEQGSSAAVSTSKPVCARAGSHCRPFVARSPAPSPCRSLCPSRGYCTSSSATYDSMRLSVELLCIVLAELMNLFFFFFFFCFSAKLLNNIRGTLETINFGFNVLWAFRSVTC